MKTPCPSLWVGATSIAILAAVSSSPAQSYSVSWNTLAGGGSASAGGGFSLNATVGQSDAAPPLHGDTFGVSGGFWPGVTVPEPIPALSIRLGVPAAGANTVFLIWPNPSTGYVLQQTANMSGPGGGWVDVGQTPVIVGANKEVTLPATGRSCMFRLRRM